MMIINLIRERKCEDELWIDTFLVDDSVLNPEQALRDAIQEYLKTDAGLKSISYSCGDFNWGDAIMDVPEEIWNRHGVHFSYVRSVDIKVNQDEVLCEETSNNEDE